MVSFNDYFTNSKGGDFLVLEREDAARRTAFRSYSQALFSPQNRRLSTVASRPEKSNPKEVRSSFVADDAFVDSVRTAIRGGLAGGNLTIDCCAKQLGMSRRTLQRLLSEAGLTFTSLANQVRLQRAKQLLADENQKVADVAAQLGYGNSANFAKAFQRLSGVTPTEFRSRLKM